MINRGGVLKEELLLIASPLPRLLFIALIVLCLMPLVSAEIDWTQATLNATFPERFEYASVVFDGKMWVMGGNGNPNKLNDVWYSSNGINWTQATASANWSARYGHTAVVFNNSMWVIGGYDNSNKNDIWRSTDGISWTRVNASAGFSARYRHTSVVTDNNTMWVIGGFALGYLNDVWYSTNGANWIQATASAGWNARSMHTSVVTNNNTIWIFGGYNGSYMNGVWYSTNGVSWTQATSNASWSKRYAHTSLAYNNALWIIGGRIIGGIKANDTWKSIDNGISWTQETASAEFSARYAHTSLIFNDVMWVIGGLASARMNDVWYSYIDTIAPVVTILSPMNITYNSSLIFLNISTDIADVCYYSLNEGEHFYLNYSYENISSDYIYAGGATTQKIRKYDKNTMAYINETASYGGIIEAISVEGDYLYAGGRTNTTIKKYDKNTMAYINETASYGGTIYSILVEGDYIYAGGATTQKIRKYDKNTMAYINETASYGGTIYSILVEGDYIYAGGSSRTIDKYNKNTLAYINETASYGGNIYSIFVEGDYIYAGGVNTSIKKYDKNTMAYINETASYGGTIEAVSVEGNYIYVGGDTLKIRKYDKNTMAYINETASYGGTIYSILVEGDYIYAGGASTTKIRKYDKNTMAYINETASYGGTIYSVYSELSYNSFDKTKWTAMIIAQEGSNIINIFCNDSVQNQGIASISFFLDTKFPTKPSLISPANNTISNNPTPLLNWNVSEEDNFANYTIQVSNDSGFSIISFFYTITDRLTNWYQVISDWTDGIWFWRVTATDTSNQQNISEIFIYNLDATAPVVTITNPTNITYNTLSITLSGSTDEASTCEYSLNGNARISLGSSPFSTPITALEGSNIVDVFCNDSLQNQGSDTISFSTDTTAPIVTITSPTNITYNTHSITLSGSTDEASNCEYSLNGDTGVSLGSSPFSTSITALEGSNIVDVFCNDSLQNQGSDTISFSTDTINPVVTLTSPTNITYNTHSITLSGSTDEASDCEYSLNGNLRVSLGASPFSTSITALEGSNIVDVFCNDSVQNQGTASVSFSTDISNPVVTIISPTATTYTILNINLTGFSSKAGNCEYSLNNNTRISLGASPFSTIITALEGSNIIYVFCNDTEQHQGFAVILFSVNTFNCIYIQNPSEFTEYDMDAICNSPSYQNYSCVNLVYQDDKLINSNPYVKVAEVGYIDRFYSSNHAVHTKFSNDYLVADTNFNFVVRCADTDTKTTFEYSKNISLMQFKDLHMITGFAVRTNDNASYIVGIGIILVFLFIAFLIWRYMVKG